MVYLFGITLTLYAFFTQAILAQDLAQYKISSLYSVTVQLEQVLGLQDSHRPVDNGDIEQEYRLNQERIRRSSLPINVLEQADGRRNTEKGSDRQSVPVVATADTNQGGDSKSYVGVGGGQDILYGFTAFTTAYTRESSCHFRTTRNGREICPMASGKDVYVGAVACPRNLALGTKVKIDGTTYTCEDRYSKSLDNLRDLPTIDIFMDNISTHEALKFGKRKVIVEVLKNN